MNWKQSLSWKLLLPLGIMLWLIGRGGILALLGTIVFLMGLVDLFRYFKNRKNQS